MRCDIDRRGACRTSIVRMSLVCKIEMRKRVHNHTHPSLNSHSFISVAVAKTKENTQQHYNYIREQGELLLTAIIFPSQP